MSVSIICIAKGMWPVTKNCLETLIGTIDDSYEIIYGENATPPGEDSWRQMSSWVWENSLRAKMFRFTEPVSLSRAWNEGLSMSVGNYLLIINNDLIFHGTGWWQEFKLSLEEPGVGIVGLNGLSWHNVPFIQGSIFAFTRETFEKIGNFDERFNFTVEDTDYSKRIQDAGLRIKSHEHLRPMIEHLNSATRNYYQDDKARYAELGHISRVRFCHKHGLEMQISD